MTKLTLDTIRQAMLNCAACDQLTPSMVTVVAKAIMEALEARELLT